MSTTDGSERDLDPVAAAGRMAILDHLRELRRRLAIIVVIMAVGTVAGYPLYQPVLAILEKPFCAVDPAYRFGGEAGRCVLVFSGVLDGFTTRLKIAALTGAVLTAPLWLYQLWAFVTPGLRKTERRYTIAFVLSSSLLFIAGAFVTYEILAKGLSMLLSQGGGDVEAMLTVTSYLSFVMLTLVVFGLSFELPLLIVIANLAGVLPSAALPKSHRIAIFVFAGIVVPSTDPFSMCAMAIPMVLLYEAAVASPPSMTAARPDVRPASTASRTSTTRPWLPSNRPSQSPPAADVSPRSTSMSRHRRGSANDLCLLMLGADVRRGDPSSARLPRWSSDPGFGLVPSRRLGPAGVAPPTRSDSWSGQPSRREPR